MKILNYGFLAILTFCTASLTLNSSNLEIEDFNLDYDDTTEEIKKEENKSILNLIQNNPKKIAALIAAQSIIIILLGLYNIKKGIKPNHSSNYSGYSSAHSARSYPAEEDTFLIPRSNANRGNFNLGGHIQKSYDQGDSYIS